VKPIALTQIKNIGEARMKLLNAHGIKTVEQLHQIPLEKLAQIKSIGRHYAELIKGALKDHYPQETEEISPKSPSLKEEKGKQINLDLGKEIKDLNKRLDRTIENLKPLWKKKHLQSFIDLKKKTNKLKAALKKVAQMESNLPPKTNKKVIKKASALRTNLKNVGKKPKKKKYKTIAREIQSLSKRLQDISA